MSAPILVADMQIRTLYTNPRGATYMDLTYSCRLPHKTGKLPTNPCMHTKSLKEEEGAKQRYCDAVTGKGHKSQRPSQRTSRSAEDGLSKLSLAATVFAYSLRQ